MTTTIFTVSGTGVDMFTGYPAEIARALTGDPTWNAVYQELTGEVPVWRWQPVWYPAAAFPMGPSVDAGVAELVRLLGLPENQGEFVLIGYSQGAIVTSKVWRDHILGGDLAHRKNDLVAHITYGNPMRAPGVANGNVYGGQPVPTTLDGQVTGGIAGPDDLTPDQTPAFQLDFAHSGDLYTSAPVGSDPWQNEAQVGKDETLIYSMVQQISVLNLLTFAATAAQLLSMTTAQVVPVIEAVLNGALFAVQGPTAPHFTYSIEPAVAYLQQLA